MDQLRRPARGVAGQVVLLDQQDRQAATRRITCDASAVDAAPDNQ
jgi:hypothetical protein